MSSNFDFLKTVDRKLFEMIETAELLYRDEYFDQCIVQVRKYAETICKKLLSSKKNQTKMNFDEMLATLCDKSTGSQQENELIEDLYFIKKQGNTSAHSDNQTYPATTALECLQRAFEVSVSYAFSRNPKKTNILKLEFDTELLITGEKTKQTLKEKYLNAKKVNEREKGDEPIVELSSKPRKKRKSNLTGGIILIIIILIYVVCLYFG